MIVLVLNISCTKDLYCHLVFFVVLVDVVRKYAREVALSDLLHFDDLVLISEAVEGLRNKFFKWKEAFESKGLKVNFRKITAWSATASQLMACLRVKFK